MHEPLTLGGDKKTYGNLFIYPLELNNMESCKRLIRRIIFSCIILVVVQGALTGETKNVLLLHSYHEGFKWTDDINRAIKEELALWDGADDMQIFVEYMDSKRHGIITLFPHLVELYEFKYSSLRPDLIICSDNNAFNFLIAYRDRLFGDVPLVFCGVNNFTPSQLEGLSRVTGVPEMPDLEGTIDLILSLQTDVTHIAAVTDSVSTGKIHRQNFTDLIPQYKDRVNLVSLAELSRPALKNQLGSLPKTSAVIYLSYFSDGEGRSFSGEEGVELVAGLSDVPVYSLWDWTLNHGVVGGILISGEEQGRVAGKMARSVLNGVSIEDIPILKRSPNVPMFDYPHMTAVLNTTGRLPRQSVVINRPLSFYEQYKAIFWYVMLIFLLLVLLIMTLVYDIGRRRRMGHVLRKQKNILQSTLDNIPLYVYWKDGKGRFLGANQSFIQRFHAREKDGFLFPSFTEEEKGKIESLEKDSGGEPLLFREITLSDHNGRHSHYTVTVIPNHDMGSPQGRLVLIQDITHRRILENQLNQSEKMQALGRLAGGIAHDFNNLLTGILGASELIRTRDLTQDERESCLEMIEESCDQAHGLIKGLLSYSRKAPLVFSDVEVDELLRNTVSILERTLNKSITLKIGEVEKGLVLKGDRSLLQSALLNLGINASDAMPRGGTLSYTMAPVPREQVPFNKEPAVPMKRYLRISVKDDGEGIAPEIMEKLFDPFFTTKETGRGTGLGLAGVMGCVKSHKGVITVDSVPGEGAEFVIYLPLNDE